jgi:hypothetical protein
MSKKLIAVASAAALALSALVGVAPATALPWLDAGTAPSGNGIELEIGANADTSTGNGTNGAPYELNVPSAGLVAAADLVKVSISSDVKSRAFTVRTTSGIKVLDAPGDATNKYTAASGLGSWDSTLDAAGKASFYAYATTTTKGILTVTLDGDVTQIYITGVAGPAYDITSVTLPSLEVEATDAIVATVTDAFGNAVKAGTLDVTRVGTGASGSSVVTYSTTSKRWEGNITAGAVAGQLAVELKINGLVENTDTKAAFGAANGTYFGVINVSAKGDVKALRAEIATLKADYNKLAARWNKLVASKKAPKKTVATK